MLLSQRFNSWNFIKYVSFLSKVGWSHSSWRCWEYNLPFWSASRFSDLALVEAKRRQLKLRVTQVCAFWLTLNTVLQWEPSLLASKPLGNKKKTFTKVSFTAAVGFMRNGASGNTEYHLSMWRENKGWKHLHKWKQVVSWCWSPFQRLDTNIPTFY